MKLRAVEELDLVMKDVDLILDLELKGYCERNLRIGEELVIVGIGLISKWMKANKDKYSYNPIIKRYLDRLEVIEDKSIALSRLQHHIQEILGLGVNSAENEYVIRI